MAKTVNPGSPEAVLNGCICPVIDNHHGKGSRGDGTRFITNAACPLHHSGHVPLKKRALKQLREWAQEGSRDECYSVDSLAVALGCTKLELHDRDHDSGALFELNQDGEINFTMDESCVYPVGLRFEWD